MKTGGSDSKNVLKRKKYFESEPPDFIYIRYKGIHCNVNLKGAGYFAFFIYLLIYFYFRYFLLLLLFFFFFSFHFFFFFFFFL